MAYFPFFIDLTQKKGLIVGGGRHAAEKVEKLKEFGPQLTVIAPNILQQIKEDETLTCLERQFAEEDVEGNCFVIAASEDRELNHRISRLCMEKNILINVVDDKEVCGFLFPALVKSGSLTVGISTAGASPRAAAAIRKRIEEELPDRMEEILASLNDIRKEAKERIQNHRDRTAFWKDAADFCMAENRTFTEEEKERWLLAYARGEWLLERGECYSKK